MSKPKVKIENWRISSPHDESFILTGHAFGHPRLGNTYVYTSRLKSINFETMEAETRNTIYKLGKPGETIVGS